MKNTVTDAEVFISNNTWQQNIIINKKKLELNIFFLIPNCKRK